MKTIQKIDHNDIYWLNVAKQGEEEINHLRQNYKFHPLDLEDCLSPAQRPKLDEYDDYLFLIFTFPVYDEKTKEMVPAEIDFFIGQDYLITVHDNSIEQLKQFFNLCKNSQSARAQFMSKDPAILGPTKAEMTAMITKTTKSSISVKPFLSFRVSIGLTLPVPSSWRCPHLRLSLPDSRQIRRR